MTKRVVQGVLYAHRGRVFAFLDTDQPYDLAQYGMLQRRARARSNPQVGQLTLQVVDDVAFPGMQAYVVQSDRQEPDRQAFAQAVISIFLGCTVSTKWITSFGQEHGHLILALIARRVLSGS